MSKLDAATTCNHEAKSLLLTLRIDHQALYGDA